MMNAGITVALGCDGTSASGSLDMIRQMHLAACLFKDARMDATLVGARKALRMATIEGARALMWDDEIGSVEPGKKADLILFNLHHPDWVPFWDPVQTLVYSVSCGSVDTVIIDGQIVMRNRRILTVNEEEIFALAREHALRVIARANLPLGEGKVPLEAEVYI
jgi:cytosine/adenosine deaminase-related metal-dependent hydrolase